MSAHVADNVSVIKQATDTGFVVLSIYSLNSKQKGLPPINTNTPLRYLSIDTTKNGCHSDCQHERVTS